MHSVGVLPNSLWLWLLILTQSKALCTKTWFKLHLPYKHIDILWERRPAVWPSACCHWLGSVWRLLQRPLVCEAWTTDDQLWSWYGLLPKTSLSPCTPAWLDNNSAKRASSAGKKKINYINKHVYFSSAKTSMIKTIQNGGSQVLHRLITSFLSHKWRINFSLTWEFRVPARDQVKSDYTDQWGLESSPVLLCWSDDPPGSYGKQTCAPWEYAC